MLLAIDVGNTNTVIGACKADEPWSVLWRFSTPRLPLGSDWAPIVSTLASRDDFDLCQISAVCICSVVPSATTALTEFANQWLELDPMVVNSNLNLGITLGMDSPAEVGTDRLANAAAAWDQLRRSCIVVDLGTATKIEAISDSGTFLGGAIAPGLGVMLEALTAKAARLFTIPLEFPPSPIGTNTSTALQSGIVLGHLHMIRGLVHDIATEIGADSRVIVTGGHAMTEQSPFAILGLHRPNLTLDGIRLIWANNVA